MWPLPKSPPHLLSLPSSILYNTLPPLDYKGLAKTLILCNKSPKELEGKRRKIKKIIINKFFLKKRKQQRREKQTLSDDQIICFYFTVDKGGPYQKDNGWPPPLPPKILAGRLRKDHSHTHLFFSTKTEMYLARHHTIHHTHYRE